MWGKCVGQVCSAVESARIRVSDKLKLSCLQVRQELLGAEHFFTVDGVAAFLQLPSFAGIRPSGTDSPLYYPVEWRGEEAGDPDTTWYAVHECSVGFRVDWPVDDVGLLRRPSSEPKRSALQTQAHGLVPRLFPVWLRTLFWIAQEYRVYQDEDVPSGGVVGGYQLHLDTSDERLNALGYAIVLDRGVKLSRQVWAAMQDAFDSGESPPIWFNYLFDARKNLGAGNATAAVISAAVACETAIRGLFWKTVSGVTHPTAERIIDNVSVQQLLTRWEELTGSTKQEMDRAGKKLVHKLFDRRNSAMHHGKVMDDLAEVRALLDAAASFILDADKRICKLAGTAHRPVSALDP